MIYWVFNYYKYHQFNHSVYYSILKLLLYNLYKIIIAINYMDLIPGFFQGLTRVLISHPFDYVRLYIQSNKNKGIKNFFKKNSIKTLYRGVSVPLITVPVDRAIQFKIYETLNKRDISPFLSGAISGLFSSFFTMPSSYICNNYVLNKNERSLYYFVKKTFYSPLKLYNGIKPEIARSIIGTSIYLGTYGHMRNNYGSDLRQSIINGAVAGWSVWTITYPLETIKIEQQLNNKKIMDILKYRISKYGILNLWKGISLIYIRTLPSSIGGMVVYEQMRNLTLE